MCHCAPLNPTARPFEFFAVPFASSRLARRHGTLYAERCSGQPSCEAGGSSRNFDVRAAVVAAASRGGASPLSGGVTLHDFSPVRMMLCE